ncbi:hypothetical protein F3Y22_tig00110383pilonHSYRG00051 [Hibiscus syriacus]|uniref:Gnk2-homologous domain-containing protein n=1 Tax=Hibiscus syriacus TaxID=106335 RepID=A0A6A3AUT6_HIBSY|nr:hypothetical protein F3Y22_tig00110383pilonHSYRG00051 [Hibiscus syriacus]
MTYLHKARSLLLCFITIFKLISSIACQSATYNNHSCLGPGNETATAGYKSNLTVLLDSVSSKASDKSFYNDSLNGIYSLFLCRGDVSSDVCRVCVYKATQTLTQAPYAENMFGTNEMFVGNGPGRRYGLVQRSRDLDVSSCSSCLGQLLNRTEECCIGRRWWRILSPSCFIRYEMYPFYDQTSSDSTGSPPVDEAMKNDLDKGKVTDFVDETVTC